MSSKNRKRGRTAGTMSSHSRAGLQRRGVPGKGNAAYARYSGVQFRGNGDSASDVHKAADKGVQGAGSALPHIDAIQRSFGSHDVSSVTAHVGGAASDACDAIGAEAYATGDVVAFKRAPDLHTAAHEAAHIVQQRSGVSLKGGVGEAGDQYEQHADKVADAVVRGDSTQGLLDSIDHGASSVQHAAIQRYTTTTIAGNDWRVGDDLTMAVRQDDPTYGGRHFYAESGLISSSTSKLAAQGSHLKMEADAGTLDVESTDKTSRKTLSRVKPSNKNDGTAGNAAGTAGMQWPEDCGLAANSVDQGPGRESKGVYSVSAAMKKSWLGKVMAYLNTERETPEAQYGTVYGTHRGRNLYSPHKMFEDIFKDVLDESNADTAWKTSIRRSTRRRRTHSTRRWASISTQNRGWRGVRNRRQQG